MTNIIFSLIAALLISGCRKISNYNVLPLTAVDNNKVIAPSSRYNRQQLQIILDSLLALDSRNTIHHQLDIYGTGKNWYTVNIHKVYDGDDNVKSNENGALQFHTGSMKNWLHVHVMNLANAITACSYDQDTFIGIHYLGDDGRVYYSSIVNLSWPNPYLCSGSTAPGWTPDIE